MFYKKLSAEYGNETEILKKHIDSLKRKLKREIKRDNLNTQNRINVLYNMYIDTRSVSKILEIRSEKFEQ